MIGRSLGPAALCAVTLAMLASGCKLEGAYDLPLPGGIVSDEDSYTVTAEFADVLNVVPRSAVMVDDVPVGEVKDIERVGWHARVTMWVRNDVTLPDNAIAEIRQTSLLGEKYVALEPPADRKPAGRLSEGDAIPLAKTGRNPEVEEVLGALSFLLSGGGVGQLSTITKELNAIMTGRTDRLRSLLTRLDDVVGTIDQQKAQIVAAMTSINGLTETLNREKRTIGRALDAIGPAVDVLSSQHADLVRMLRALDRLGVVGTSVIDASKEDLIRSLSHLEPVLTRLNATGSSLVSGVSLLLSFPFPVESNDIVHGDYANTRMRIDVSADNFLLPGSGGGGGGGSGGGGGGGGLPGLPLPELPLPGLPLPDLPLPSIPGLPLLGRQGTVTTSGGTTSSGTTLATSDPAAAACARAGNILSPACRSSLSTAARFHTLMQTCLAPSLRDTRICRSLGVLPMREVDSVEGPPVLGLGAALTQAFDTPLGSQDTLYGVPTARTVAP